MGGVSGCVLDDRTDVVASARLLGRMLLAPASAGRGARHGRAAAVAVFGAHDADLAEDLPRGELVAVSGYVRVGARAASARDVLRAWQAEGERCLRTMSGEFSLAVVSPRRVVVARDALGGRPMYVAELGRGGVAFSTSLFALLHAGVAPDIDRDAVVRSLVMGYPTAPVTTIRGIRQLGPGELWELAPRRSVRRWFLARERLDRERSFSAAVRAVDRAVHRAVREALPPAARVAAFLSGGVDSSIVLARLQECGASVDAFTLYFGDHLPGEIRYSAAVARHLGVRQQVFEVDARRFCEGLQPATTFLEDVVSEAIAIPNFLLAREAARTHDVIFTGEGGDQSFGGPKNLGMALAYAYSGHPCAPPLGRTYLSLHHYLWGDLEAALAPEVLADFDPQRLESEVWGRFHERAIGRGESFVGRAMVGNTVIKGGSNILVKAAKMIGVAHDVALRSPLFDRRVVALGLTIPPWYKLDGTAEKLVLRGAARRSLPAWVVDRPKRGMTLPLGAWFQGELGALARDTLTRRAVQARGLFRWRYVEDLLDRARSVRGTVRDRTIDQLWMVFITELHHRTIDRLVEDVGRAARAAVPPEVACA